MKIDSVDDNIGIYCNMRNDKVLMVMCGLGE